DHALFAHRDVAENVAFGLRMAGVGADDRALRIREVLDLVGLATHGDRSIDTLSGGEAQRVALARSLAPRPRLLMLDEPLGSLDRTLRDRLAVDLRRILASSGTAAIHVTHDQEEAYAVADRLVVMRDGRIERDGPVAEVWADPRTEFVARFLGHHNVLEPETARALGFPVPRDASGLVVRESAVTLVG
ncbi:MAG: ABC transporter ATP-binding protein, partial [Actinobacteria bacterium]|nr:ABC transporter ATP-binding protein [Actinomycetota bacterium]